jgi:hypothetical protein
VRAPSSSFWPQEENALLTEGGIVIKTKLASVLTWAVLFLAGMPFAQTDPGVQSANRGTGGTLINPGNDPNGFYPFFTDGLFRF